MAKKDIVKETIDNVWPKTKKELEKALKNTRSMLVKGEKYLKTMSDKGIEKTKKLSLTLRKEKLYYDLGKASASISPTKWKGSKKITGLMKEFKDLDVQIKKIK